MNYDNKDDHDFDDFNGEGLNGIMDRVQGFFRGVRLDFPPNERHILKLYGHYRIKKITLCRTPINSMLNTVLDVISFGQWSTLKNKYSFDSLFHLFMIVELDNGFMMRIEKNQVVKMSLNFKIENDTQFDYISINKHITLNELLQNTIKTVGLKQFFVYSPWSTNCQQFLLDILHSNGLLTEKAKHFIYQDITQLVENLPWITKQIGQKTTDLAHTMDVLVHGQALKYKNKI